MIEILGFKNGRPEVTENPVTDYWINVISPTQDELDKIKEFLKVSDETIMSLQDMDELPMMEKEDGSIFIIVRTAQRQDINPEFITIPLGIVVSEHVILTICFQKNDILKKLRTKDKLSRKNLLLRLLYHSTKTYLDYLKEMNKKTNKIQDDLEHSQTNEDIVRLMNLEKSLVYFMTSLKSNEIMFEKIAKSPHMIRSEKDRDLIEDIIDENKQAIEMTSIYSRILKNMRHAFESIISNNLNKNMKSLSLIAIIMSVPVIVSSIYGMNIALPMQTHPWAFGIVIGLSIVFAAVGALVLWRAKLI